MEAQTQGSLKVRPIKTAVKSAIDYVHKRRSGELTSLKTSFVKLNNALLNGVD